MPIHRRVYGLTCVLLLLAVAASATTIVMPTDEQLVAKSPLIIEAHVVDSIAVDRNGAIWTETTLAVEKVLKGSASGELKVAEIGGELDGRITKIFGAPEYTPGQRVLAFLTPTPRGDYQTIDLYVGKFTERRMLNGETIWQRDPSPENVSLLDNTLRVASQSNVQRRGAAFEQFIVERAHGLAGKVEYRVENPVLEQDPVTAAHGGGITANFTLIDEGTVYRWARFDTGGSASWYSYGTQPGYTGGGVNEVQTAMAAWNGYSAANIHYNYAGTTQQHGGNVAANGINEVLFNDPNQEIAGSWNPSTGGVVGLGGFNGISGASNWTAPFTADANHAQATYRAYNITEGNFVVQDGVSAAAGIPSRTLAEIACHEFGHTLGFGHSSDPTALMYPTVSGGGPALRTDDQTAARWLYPSGNVSTPPPSVPSAPTALTGSVNGGSVILQWVDNATNETSQSIYYAVGNGAFTKAADIAASQTSATLNGFTPGTYRFYVVAVNAAGNSANSNTVQLTVNATVTASFTATPTSGIAGQTNFSFVDQSSGTVTSRQWTFGDGSTSTVASPSHVYGQPGQYTVVLTVNGSGGTSSQSSRTISVSAPSTPPSASFTFSPTTGTVNQDVLFSDTSTGAIASWSWNFGDGSTSTQQNALKRYAAAGTYHVSLSVSNAAGQSSVTSRDITILAQTPAQSPVTAAFDATPQTAAAGDTVSFFDRSTGNPTSWQWSFGDGASSSAQNPVHVFTAAGTYTVVLTASNGSSSSSVSKSITINAAASFRTLVSVTATTNGVGGSVWRTELTIFNPTNANVTGTATFLPGAGGSVVTRPIFLTPKQLVVYGNALADVFGITSGAGAIAIEADGGAASLRVSSRTFTTGATGTYGQSVPDVAKDDLQQTLYLTGLESDSSFRTNLGLVNRSASTVQATLLLLDAEGRTIGQASVDVPPVSFQQSSLAGYFPGITGRSYDSMSLRVVASAAEALSVYGSIVDNRTQDPVYLQASPLSDGTELVIPAVGRTPGANNTFWRSDVTLFNPTSSFMNLEVRYLASGADNRTATARAVSIAPARTIVLADVLSWLGLASGSGALDIRWSGTTAPVVTSRTYTSTTDGGTYGQSIDAASLSSFGRDAYVTGLRADGSFRSNVGFVNSNDAAIGINVALVANGQTVATTFVQLAPKSQQQYSMPALFPNVNASALGSFTIEAHTATPSLFAYGSIVDNGSGDPVFFGGK